MKPEQEITWNQVCWAVHRSSKERTYGYTKSNHHQNQHQEKNHHEQSRDKSWVGWQIWNNLQVESRPEISKNQQSKPPQEQAKAQR